MSVRIDVRYEGELHTRAVHGPSGAKLETDAPKDNEGRGEAFSPTDLLATALGTCMLTVMGIYARRKGWELAGARVTVDKHMVADPVRRIGRLAVHIEMPAGIPEEANCSEDIPPPENGTVCPRCSENLRTLPVPEDRYAS